MSLPRQYETVFNVLDYALSGREKHCITITRAIGKGARLLYLIRRTVRCQPVKLVLMIAHRLGTIVVADHIIAMDKGRVSGLAIHVELLENNDIYSELWGITISFSF